MCGLPNRWGADPVDLWPPTNQQSQTAAPAFRGPFCALLTPLESPQSAVRAAQATAWPNSVNIN